MQQPQQHRKWVKITRGSPGSWYHNLIGDTFEVYGYDGDYYLMDEFNPYEIGIGRYIKKGDCEDLSAPASPVEEGDGSDMWHPQSYKGRNEEVDGKTFYCVKPSEIPCQVQCPPCANVDSNRSFCPKPSPVIEIGEEEMANKFEEIMNWIADEFVKPENALYNFDQYRAGAIDMYHKMQRQIDEVRNRVRACMKIRAIEGEINAQEIHGLMGALKTAKAQLTDYRKALDEYADTEMRGIALAALNKYKRESNG